jgi:hypothetical protein
MPAEGMKFNYQADYEALDSGLAGDIAQGIAGLLMSQDLQIELKRQ